MVVLAVFREQLTKTMFLEDAVAAAVASLL